MRLDNFLITLQNDPNSTGYVINYGSKREVSRREKLFRTHFRDRNFQTDRIVFVNGGIEKRIRTRLWIVPAGADPSEIN